MYQLLYGLLFLVSLLPFRMLYMLSDLTSFILFRVAGYRKEVVLKNLEIAFPEKSPRERIIIARKFYRNLTDTFIESIKLLSISDKEFDRRVFTDLTVCNQLISEGRQIQVHSGHQMNWEYAHLAFARNLKTLWVGVYMPISNPHIDRLFLKIRRKFNSYMLAASDFNKEIRNIYGRQYALALIADQNPGRPKNSYWLNFFGKPAPFLAGPEKGATRNGTSVVFVNFIKLKRGYYRFDAVLVTKDASKMQEGELTLKYRDFLEDCIRNQPENYLWSHRRWKWEYQPQYQKRWIDHSSPSSANIKAD